jgi:hypothetical protein|tara:strand:+ start:582 stop:1859 length:1278 start_codon:yes stop_codon:yes gene_type:complete
MRDSNIHYTLLVAVFLLSSSALGAESVYSLISRASAHEANQQHELAGELYEAAVAETTALRGESSMELLEPLLGISRTLIAQGEFEAATKALRNAQLLAHRNEGVYSLRQLEVIDHLTDIALKSDDVLTADHEQKFSFFISEHFYGETSLDLLPAYYKLVEWYLQTGRHYWVRRELRRAESLIREQAGDHDPILIEFLLLSARSKRLSGICCSEKILEEALDIIAANPQLPNDVKSTVYFALGDAYTVSGKTHEAADHYALTNMQRNERPTSEPTMIAMLDYLPTPSLVFMIPLSENGLNVKLSDGPQGLKHLPVDERSRDAIGHPIQFMHYQLEDALPFRFRDLDSLAGIAITLEFTVTREGKVRDVELIGSNAPFKLNQVMSRVLARTIYRPALAQGIPVDTEQVTLTQTFAVGDPKIGATEN